jgi:hypothetical protein
MRLPDPGIVDMIHRGAWAKGAHCDLIPRRIDPHTGDGPGDAFVIEAGEDPLRVKSFFLDDDAVRHLAATCARPR